jgi:hypothetical protein
MKITLFIIAILALIACENPEFETIPPKIYDTVFVKVTVSNAINHEFNFYQSKKLIKLVVTRSTSSFNYLKEADKKDTIEVVIKAEKVKCSINYVIKGKKNTTRSSSSLRVDTFVL